ncbi:Ribonuclease H domain [Arabidopsis thaliana x Arabidopsis arenosa]|uniref:Ribonuclease H domain n=1 Tax=Arabidopsis thaliana x Arabidopsis arenosa TaxID=1240361 RepID=A0A8T2FJH8_9BRAS|nr:Ribonuclease H domain [Arabidopsis thaliana x Arabidopsis arenosa]
MSRNDGQSSGDQASILDDIKQLLQKLSKKTDRQQLAVTSLSNKFVTFQEQCNDQLAALAANHSEIRSAHNAYAERTPPTPVEVGATSTQNPVTSSSPARLAAVSDRAIARTPVQLDPAIRLPTSDPRQESNAINSELQNLQDQIWAMNAKVHQATTSAPEVEKLPVYNGKGDLKEHLTSFQVIAGRVPLEPHEEDPGLCKLFSENLFGPALTWFTQLEEGSIDNFKQLSTAFIKQYGYFIDSDITEGHLWNLSQSADEPLRTYITAFKEIMVQIPSLSDLAAQSALKNGLWHESRFRESLTVNRPETIQDALHRATNWINAEEERAFLAKKFSASNAVPKAPQPATTKKPTKLRKPAAGTFSVEKESPKSSPKASPSKPPFSPKGKNGALPSNKWVRDPNAYCDIHKMNGHATKDCKALGRLLAAKYASGEISEVDITAIELAQTANETLESEEASPPNKKQKSEPAPVIPKGPKKMVKVIMGGSKLFRDSISAIKQHERRTVTPIAKKPKTGRVACPEISFTEEETSDLDKLHDEALVITLDIANCEIQKILIDTGSSVDLIFLDTLLQMGISKKDIKGAPSLLVSFTSETSMSLGTVVLPLTAQGVVKMVEFTVFDRPAAYNVILGTLWLYEMKPVPSTYHQCVKFPTPGGIGQVLGSQRDDLVERVVINDDHPDQLVGIGANLGEDFRSKLVRFLKTNKATFAWTVGEMTGISMEVISHELNVDATFKPVKQKRRKLGPDRAQAVNVEVVRLLEVGLIREVKYPEWLANPVVVKKKNGKWRVCVDFTDLNKACPKDCFSLPHIDRLVESTTGHEMLSFMDAFSGYNQIPMNPEDQEKTSFITECGTYCYKVMPFRLKNAGATYQRLVNRMFKDLLGKTMEVYIDDMLVKSTLSTSHFDHLQQCFDILNEFGMKLNPSKCNFAVPSGEFLGVSLSNNEAEYESLLAGLRLAIGVGVRNLHAHCDSLLLANQYSGEYEAKNARMEAYLNLVREVSGKFEQFELTRIPRAENSAADALASLASTFEVTLPRVIPVETISQPSIRLDEISFVTTRAMRRRLDAQSAENGLHQLGDDEEISDAVHPTEIVENQSLPDNHNVPLPDQPPHDWGQTRENQFGITFSTTRTVMKEVHDGTCGNHTGGRSLAFKVRKYDYYWPTLVAECEAYARKCEQCQKHAPLILQPTELLTTVSAPYPFMKWSMEEYASCSC